MTLSLQLPESTVLKPQITVFGVGGAGCNATNNMIKANLEGANFVVANTDAQSLENAIADKRIQLGKEATKGLGAGAAPEVGRKAAEETLDEIMDHLQGSNMVFITAGMGGGTGTGAAPVVAKAAREMGILTVGVVTKPFHFEGPRRMRLAEEGLEELQKHVDTLIIIPNQNLFRIANERTTFAEAFSMADAVLHAGVRGITDLMVMPGLINLDFADVRSVMSEMGKAMMGTGEAEGEKRAQEAAEAAISNPLLDNVSMKGARGVLINITGGSDMTLFEVDEAANRIREEVDPSANIIFGSTFNDALEGKLRVSVVATGIDAHMLTPDDDDEAVEERKPAASFSAAVAPKKEAEKVKEATVRAKDQRSEEKKVAEAQEAIENATNAAYQQLKNEVEKTFAPSDIDDKYFEAIKNLNEEYKVSRLSQPQEDEAGEEVESEAEARVFVAPEPVQPSSYAQTSYDAPSEEQARSYYRRKEEADVQAAGQDEPLKSGGIFSKMARVARSLGGDAGNADEEWKEHTYEYATDEVVGRQSGPAASSSSQKQEDLLDIPAFLRRKV